MDEGEAQCDGLEGRWGGGWDMCNREVGATSQTGRALVVPT